MSHTLDHTIDILMTELRVWSNAKRIHMDPIHVEQGTDENLAQLKSIEGYLASVSLAIKILRNYKHKNPSPTNGRRPK